MKTPKEKAAASRLADLSKAIAKVYNLDAAPEVFDEDYETQMKSPQFINVLLFNCMVMNSLHGCRRGGCVGCRVREVFDNVAEDSLKRWIAATMCMIDEEDSKHRKETLA